MSLVRSNAMKSKLPILFVAVLDIRFNRIRTSSRHRRGQGGEGYG
jgi:hypothetical protein